MAGRLVNVIVGDPHASLVWISVMAGSGLVAVMYWLGTAMFGRKAGWIAGVMAATSPMCWFHSAVALTYVVDALLVSATVLWCWLAMRRGVAWEDAVGLGLMLAVVAGVRTQTAVLLGVPVLLALRRARERRAGKVLLAVLAGGLASAVWFVPMLATSGGWDVYRELVRLHGAFNAPATWLGGGGSAFWENVWWILLFCWNGLGLGAVALVVGLGWRLVSRRNVRAAAWWEQRGEAMKLIGVWIVALMVAGAVGFTKQPGYVMSYLPGLLLLASMLVSALERKSWLIVSSAVIAAGNVTAFALMPSSWDGLFGHVGRTAREIREHDRYLNETVRELRDRFRTNEVVVCHGGEFYLMGIRHFQLHAPEYEHVQLIPDPTLPGEWGMMMWRVENGRLGFINGWSLPEGKQAVLVVPQGQGKEIFARWFDVEQLEKRGSFGVWKGSWSVQKAEH
jgi:hypothetical protein